MYRVPETTLAELYCLFEKYRLSLSMSHVTLGMHSDSLCRGLLTHMDLLQHALLMPEAHMLCSSISTVGRAPHAHHQRTACLSVSCVLGPAQPAVSCFVHRTWGCQDFLGILAPLSLIVRTLAGSGLSPAMKPPPLGELD